jgi:hypothetical protein
MRDGNAVEPYAFTRAQQINARIDTTKPHPARVYDVLLGGKDNYPVDRAAARTALAANPRGYLTVRHNRDFVRRAIEYLTADVGVRQFLDVGTGLPTAENVHEIAQRIAPESRIVYVDNDPIVLAHARALLTSGPGGVTDYLDADLREADTIAREAARTLDFDRPVALVLAAILHFVQDEAAYGAVRRLTAALAPGSYVVLSHLTADLNPVRDSARGSYQKSGMDFVLRSKAEIQRLLADNALEAIEPGIVPVHHWRPDHRPWAPSTHRPWEPSIHLPVESDPLDHVDDIDKIRYRDIHDVTDADVNIYGVLARKS